MRIWKPLAPPKDIDSRIYEVLRRLNEGSQQVSKSINNITNQITVLGTNPDLTNYFYLPGRATGQFGLGSNQGTFPGTGKCLTLQGYNLFGTNATDNSARIEVEQSVNIRCANLLVCERIGSFTTGFVVATASVGTGNVNVTATGTVKVKSASAASDIFMVDTATGANVGANKDDATFRRLNTVTTGNFAIFESATAIGSSRTTLSSIRKSDGAWVGPVVASGTDTHLDSIFSIADETTGFTTMFQLSGLTANRVLTVPDASGSLILSVGPSTGQVIGSTLPTSGTTNDLAINGKLMLGDGAAFSTERLLDLSNTNVTTNGSVTQLNHVMTLKPTGVPAGQDYRGYQSTITDSNTFTTGSGSYGMLGILLTMTCTPPSGVTASSVSGFSGSVTGTGGAGTITSLIGGTWTAQGGAAGLPAITSLYGLQLKVGQKTSAVTTVRGISLENPGGATTGAVTDFIGIDYSSTFGTGASVTTWSGLRHASGPAAGTNKWFFNLSSTSANLGNRILYKTAIGWTPATVAAVTAMLHLGTGTTALAPLMLTAGTNLTVALAGAAEYDGSLFYLTHGDAVRTAIPTRRGIVDATAQTAAIGATTLYAAPAAGYYLVHYTLEDTAADITAGTIQFQVNFTDDIGASNQTGAALAMTAVGRDRGSFNIYMAAAGNIQYQTNLVGIVGTAQYALRVRLVHLG